MEASAAPGTFWIMDNVAVASRRSSVRSGPPMITARSAEEPVTDSVTVSMIGCVKLRMMPGMSRFSSFRRSLTRSALVRPGAHVEYGFNTRSSSLRFGPNGSVPESLRPDCELTSNTSGCFWMSARMSFATRADFSSDVPGGRLARTQMTPSSSCGRNSVPSRVPSANARAMIKTADTATMIGTRSSLLRIHSYRLVSQVITGFCHGAAPLRKRNVARTGTSVSAQIREPTSAEHTVNAIGVNKRRSTRSRVNSGR